MPKPCLHAKKWFNTPPAWIHPLVLICVFFYYILASHKMTHDGDALITNWMFSRCCEVPRELDSMFCCCGTETETLMSRYIKSDLRRCAALSASSLVSRLWEPRRSPTMLFMKKKQTLFQTVCSVMDPASYRSWPSDV